MYSLDDAAHGSRSRAQNDYFLVPKEEVPGSNTVQDNQLVFFKVSWNWLLYYNISILVICEARASKNNFIRHVLLYLVLPKNVLCGIDAKTRDSEILDLINPDHNISFNVSLIQTPACPIVGRKNYIPVFVVSIGVRDWSLNIKVNSGLVFLGFNLPSPSLRCFLKSSFSDWSPKTRWGWRVSFLFSDFRFFGASISFMVWGSYYSTPKHYPTIVRVFRVDTSCVCYLNFSLC